MFPLFFRPEVSEDIQSAYRWYESRRKGLGEDFFLMLEESFSQIARDPLHYQTIYKKIRRKLLRRFPYSIFFVFRDERVVVLAVLHSRQSSRIWKSRTG